MTMTSRDLETATALAGTAGSVEVRWPDGRILGQFMPAPRPGMRFPELGITDEEMDRRLNDPDAKWVTGDEVMARLHSLRNAP